MLSAAALSADACDLRVFIAYKNNLTSTLKMRFSFLKLHQDQIEFRIEV